MRTLYALVLTATMAACQPAENSESPAPEAAPVAADAAGKDAGSRLADVLAAMPDDAKARYQYRHPAETIEFFGIEPGITGFQQFPGGPVFDNRTPNRRRGRGFLRL